MLQARENEISLRKRSDGTAQLRTLEGNIGPHITSPDRGEKGFQNDDGVKNRYLKF